MTYDSTQDTTDHIAKVAANLLQVASGLAQRAADHDRSKLEPPEKEGFDKFTPLLAEVEYGSPEYRRALDEMQPFLDHHYGANDHHPEHFQDGVVEMDMVQLIEMLADWKAAGERHADGGDLRRSIHMNQGRFGYDDALRELLLRTASRLGWLS